MNPRRTYMIWVTKYWATRGILKMKAEIDANSPGMAIQLGHANQYFHGNEWWGNEYSAIRHVNEVLLPRKIASLEKSIAKLKSHKITVVEAN